MSLSKTDFVRQDIAGFIFLVAMMVMIAIGQLFVLPGLKTTVRGLPVWVWAQLGFMVILLALAWIATGLVVDNGGE